MSDDEALDVWAENMKLEGEIERQRKVISAMIEDCQYLKDKQIEAADEIEKLRAALKPFAYYASQIPDGVSDTASASGTVGDLRAAAAALKETDNG